MYHWTRSRITTCLLFLITCALSLHAEEAAEGYDRNREGQLENAQELVHRSTLVFLENNGRIRDENGRAYPEIAFTSSIGHVNMYFTNSKVSYIFNKVEENKPEEQSMMASRSGHKVTSYRMDMELVGSNPMASIRAQDQAEGHVNIFNEQKGNEFRGLKRYKTLIYNNVYPNIDLAFYSHEQGLKYDFIVHPGGDVGDIVLRYSGADDVQVSERGTLQLSHALGGIEEGKPYTYQTSDAGQQAIATTYRVQENEVRFAVGEYDPERTLVIDPLVNFSGVRGNTSEDQAMDVTFDPTTGDYYVVGWAYDASTLPSAVLAPGTVSSAFDKSAFISKFSNCGIHLWTEIIGGSNDEEGHGVVYDPGRDIVYMVGWTESANFPTNALDASYNGNRDGFVAAFSGSVGSPAHYIWSSFIGGDNYDDAMGVELTGSDNIVISGASADNIANGTWDVALVSPVIPVNAHNNGGLVNNDAYVLSIAISAVPPHFPAGAFANIFTYLGGEADDRGTGINMLPNGLDCAISGWTQSALFPASVPPGGFSCPPLSAGLGGTDAFAARFTAPLVNSWATIIGRAPAPNPYDTFGEDILAKAYSPGNMIHVVGYTNAPEFCNAAGPVPSQTGNLPGAANDGFVTTLDAATGELFLMALFYGSTQDYCWSIDDYGDETFLIGGHTLSVDLHPIRLAFQPNSGGALGTPDGWWAKLGPALNVYHSTYYGTADREFIRGIAGFYNAATDDYRIATVGYANLSSTPAHDPAICVNTSVAPVGSNNILYTEWREPGKFPTYYGAAGDDFVAGMGGDSEFIKVCGYTTSSSNFSSGVGIAQAAYFGNTDAYVMAFDGNGNFLWCTYLGGSDEDWARGVDEFGLSDAAGGFVSDVLVTGYTYSNNFLNAYTPVLQTKQGALRNKDAWVASLDVADGSLNWFTYYGGVNANEDEEGRDVSRIREANGSGVNTDYIVFAGITLSNNLLTSLAPPIMAPPATGKPYAFVTWLTVSGSPLVGAVDWMTYYGATAPSYVPPQNNPLDWYTEFNELTVVPPQNGNSGRVICVGNSSEPSFRNWPTTSNPHSAAGTGNRNQDHIVVQFDNDRSVFPNVPTLMWAGAYGTFNVDEYSNGVTVDRTSASAAYPVFVCGFSKSDGMMNAGTGASAYTGAWDASILQLNSAGTLQWYSYLGGLNNDRAFKLALDELNQDLYVTGYTGGNGFPIVGASPQQSVYGGGASDAFVARYRVNGLGNITLGNTSYYGGSSNEEAWGIALSEPRLYGLDVPENPVSVYMAGHSLSNNLSVNFYAHQTANAGGWDTFVARHEGAGLSRFNKESPVTRNERPVLDVGAGASALRAYPNPTSGAFTLEVSGVAEQEIHIAVADALGQRIVARTEAAPANLFSVRLDLSGKAAGTYFVSVSVGDSKWVMPIVKR